MILLQILQITTIVEHIRGFGFWFLDHSGKKHYTNESNNSTRRVRMKKCPECKVALEERVLESITVDECPACKGIWYDKDELRLAKDAADPDLTWLDFDLWKHEDEFSPSPSSLECAVCGAQMVSLEYGHTGVRIEHCPECGSNWLSKNAFEKIIAALEDELLNKSLSEYLKTTLKEGKEIVTGHESFLSEWKDFSTVLRLMEYRLMVEKPSLSGMIKSVQNSFR